MGTRCLIRIAKETPYIISTNNGKPAVMLPVLKEYTEHFYATWEGADAQFLLAGLVTWIKTKPHPENGCKTITHPRDFDEGSVGITNHNLGDKEYLYEIYKDRIDVYSCYLATEPKFLESHKLKYKKPENPESRLKKAKEQIK